MLALSGVTPISIKSIVECRANASPAASRGRFTPFRELTRSLDLTGFRPIDSVT